MKKCVTCVLTIAIAGFVLPMSSVLGKQSDYFSVTLSESEIRIADQDQFDDVRTRANILKQHHPLARWASSFNGEAADIISFLDQDRVLVGTVESSAKMAIPNHGDLQCMDVNTGEILWRAGRKGLNTGHYVLVLTHPLIIIAGNYADKCRLSAYDPDNGTMVWEYTVTVPEQLRISEQRDSIFILSSEKQGRKLDLLDLTTGKPVWTTTLPSDAFTADRPEYLQCFEGAVFVTGEKILKLSQADGSRLWTASNPLLENRVRFVSVNSEGILCYTTEGVNLVDLETGNVVWKFVPQNDLLRHCALLEKTVYVIIRNKSGKITNKGRETLLAIDTKNGNISWSYPIEGTVVSPLCLEDNMLIFTTDEALFVLAAETGRIGFRKQLSEAFIAGAPRNSATLERPDVLQFSRNRVYVARENAGIAAFAFPAGKMLWEQLQFEYTNRAYSTDRAYTFIAKTYLSDPAEPDKGPVLPMTSTSINPFQQSAQLQYGIWRDVRSTLSRRPLMSIDIADESTYERMVPLTLQISEMQMNQALERMQAAGDLAVSVINFAAAVKTALEKTAYSGMITREYMFLHGVMALPSTAFQRGYYVWPFQTGGDRGVTLVDLKTGNRNDVIYSPYLNVLDSYGANLPVFTLSPDGKTLVLAGIGLDTEKYEKHKKWKTSFPKSSILAYDVAGFNFSETSSLQVQQQETAEEAAVLAQQIMEIDKIHTAAQAGNMDLVTRLLDSGVSVDVPNHDNSGTPLVFAVIGNQVEMVRFLISRGANVNFQYGKDPSVLGYANMFKNKEILDMLKKAGAK